MTIFFIVVFTERFKLEMFITSRQVMQSLWVRVIFYCYRFVFKFPAISIWLSLPEIWEFFGLYQNMFEKVIFPVHC